MDDHGARQPGPTPAPPIDPPDLVPARMLNELAFCPRLFALEWIDGQWRDNEHTVAGKVRHARTDSHPAPRSGASGIPGADGETTAISLSSEALGLTAKLDRVRIRGREATPIEVKKGKAPAYPVAIPADLLAVEAGGAEAEEDADETSSTPTLPSPADRGGSVVSPADGGGSVVSPAGGGRFGDAGGDGFGVQGAMAWWPDQVQVAAQAMLLEERGFEVPIGVLYYAAEKRTVELPIGDGLRQAVRALLARAKAVGASGELPPPLVDSPKCLGCSLQPICLPDEVAALRRGAPPAGPPDDGEAIRRILAPRDDEVPVYVLTQGAYVRKRGETLRVEAQGELLEDVPIAQVRQVCLFGNVQISTQAVAALADAQIPIVYLSRGGHFRAMTTGLPLHNVLLRKAQYERIGDPEVVLELARGIVEAKIHNQRVMLMRNSRAPEATALARMQAAEEAARAAPTPAAARGFEGEAAAEYFRHFASMFRQDEGEDPLARFDFEGRNRRPPRDPINAMLSFGYALLGKDLTAICLAVGLDPALGAFHAPGFRRPALALDLMEEFRPLVVDSTVLTLVNNRMVSLRDFVRVGDACELRDGARRRFLEAYERRLQALVTHPLFGYRISYRRAMDVQCRLFGRRLAGELPAYAGFRTR